MKDHLKEEEEEPINIYLVSYKLSIDSNIFSPAIESKVRCIAYDKYMAMSLVGAWLKTTDSVWLEENESIVTSPVPSGIRDVLLIKIEVYAKDVGEMLKQCPLPEIFSEG